MADASPLAVWLADLETDVARIEAAAGRLQIDVAEPAIDQRRRLAHLALRSLLAGYIGAEAARAPFAVGPEGKPLVATAPPGQTLDFSLAHSESVALIAISRRGPVGVDIETPRQVRISDHRRRELEAVAQSLSPAEPLPASPPDTRFLQAWVRLEALAKATGEGIGSLLGRIREGSGSLELGADFITHDLHLPSSRTLYGAIASSALAHDASAPPVAPFPAGAKWLVT